MLNKKERILLLSSNLWSFGEGMLGPLFAVYSQKLGGNILDISWAWATYLVVTGIAIVIVGNYCDKKGSKEKIMVAGFALNAFFTFCYLLVASPFQLIVVQAGIGIATALATPTWRALYDKYSDDKHDGYIWGLASGQAYIATGIAIVIGGLLVSLVSFSALFITMGSVQVVATIYQSKILFNK